MALAHTKIEGKNDSLGMLYFGSFRDTFTFLITVLISVTLVRCVSYPICSMISGYRLFEKLNASILNSRMAFFDRNNDGRILNRLSQDMYEVDYQIPLTFHIFMEGLVASTGFCLGIMYRHQ